MATVEPPDEPALSPNVAFIMLDLLRRVVTSGTAHDLPNDWLVAGKTGTTNEFDAWFVGIDGRYTTVVWVGADQNQRPLGAGASTAQRRRCRCSSRLSP
ncbi:MAG: penicillin-binding transpeptidase domain-containing protein [bacterium]